VFERLFAQFMSSQMIFFAMRGGRDAVGVGRKVVEFCGSIMWARHISSSQRFDVAKSLQALLGAFYATCSSSSKYS
jgi:hypothetical protein